MSTELGFIHNQIIHNWLPMDDVLVSVGSFFVAMEIIFPSSKYIVEMICLINSSESLPIRVGE